MRRTTATLGTALACLVLVAGCSDNAGQDDDESQADQSPTATAAADAPTALQSQPEPSQGAPATDEPSPTVVTASPDADQTSELISRLGAIAPDLAENRDRTVLAATELCTYVVRGADDTALSSNASLVFADDGGPQLTDEQSRDAVEAVRDTFCHE
ncbi:hypothetical protein AB2L27_04130 [Kineococcus sp. LSe6-4]|uniref:DUF732 domain-containing protein n=1 Tax=Kineococcus halophytocola TaxID=3234027 RepID=A0ABV4GX96_9ACTN